MIYLVLKVVHLLAVFAWMAGLFYLPRLFVYHCEKPIGGESDVTFKLMEQRLLRLIMRPAALVALVSGVVLVFILELPLLQFWLLGKLLAVAMMVGFHGLLERHGEEFQLDLRLKSARYFRVINEVPTVLLVCIVVMVVVRPFS